MHKLSKMTLTRLSKSVINCLKSSKSHLTRLNSWLVRATKSISSPAPLSSKLCASPTSTISLSVTCSRSRMRIEDWPHSWRRMTLSTAAFSSPSQSHLNKMHCLSRTLSLTTLTSWRPSSRHQTNITRTPIRVSSRKSKSCARNLSSRSRRSSVLMTNKRSRRWNWRKPPSLWAKSECSLRKLFRRRVRLIQSRAVASSISVTSASRSSTRRWKINSTWSTTTRRNRFRSAWQW